MARREKTAREVREEAYRLALYTAEEREKVGDPEGAEEIRDLAKSIKRISIRISSE